MGQTFSSCTADIASGASLSGVFRPGEKTICAVIMPATWTTAGLSFQVSDDGGTTWRELQDQDGVAIVVAAPAAAGRYNLSAMDFQSANAFKVRSGTVGSPVVQGGARTLTFITRKFYPLR